MNQVYIDTEKSLTTNTSDSNYFYLTNSEYSSPPTNSYFYLEDNGFSLNYSDLQYCQTNTNPGSSPDIAISNCNFDSLPLVYAQTYLSPIKYHYMVYSSGYYDYTIIYYNGSYSSGILRVTSNNCSSVPDTSTIEVPRNSKISLTTDISYDKFFFLTNSEYSSYSYIYILFEDNGFSLNSDIKYCLTSTSPFLNPIGVLKDCSFSSVSYYKRKMSPTSEKYYYRISTKSSYNYTLIYYSGSNTSGELNVISNYNDLFQIIKMTRVYRNSHTSLPTTISYDKYFYLRNGDYSSLSYIYILLEDNGFDLDYSDIKYCQTDINPNSDPDSAVSSCSFSSISYYNSRTSSSPKKYYYRISTSLHIYIIISYSGSFSDGSLYVTTNDDDLYQTIMMTQVYRNSHTSLPTNTSKDKYFYLRNGDYSSLSYIYILLADNGFNLDYSDIKYCHTNTNPNSDPDSAVSSCSFSLVSYYNNQTSSSPKKYYYNISYNSHYNYNIISYSGNYSNGSLYVTTNDKDFSGSDSYEDEDSSTVLIISVTIGVFIFLVVFTIILIRCCRRRRTSKINSSIPVTQPTYTPLTPDAYSVEQPAYNSGGPIPL